MALRHTKKRQGWKTHYLRWLRARRHTKKEAGLENTLPKVVDGPKAHLKREAGLENTLPKRWLMALGRTKKGR
jgi:hypothetical protein